MLFPRFTRPTVLFLLSILGLAALLTAAGCSDGADSDPAGEALATAETEGSLDPGAGSLVLKTLEGETPGGRPLWVDLLGSDLTVDPDSNRVSLMVALRSRHEEPLHAPVWVWVGALDPEGVSLLDADEVHIPVTTQDAPLDPGPEPGISYGFDYSELVGPDGVLEPGETSAPRTWTFALPELAPFTFGARIRFGAQSGQARLGGICFIDENRNGRRDPGEPPLPRGLVQATLPGGQVEEVSSGSDGRYALPISEAGLYSLRFFSPLNTPVHFSTPNPRQVVIPVGPDGALSSFLAADFGVIIGLEPGPPPVRFSDAPLDSLHREPWNLASARVVEGHLLELEVGFSGCQPDHPFSLWTTGDFMESFPVQVNLLAVHELAEDCDAAFMGERLFDLGPLARHFLEAYGPGVLLLNVRDYHGHVQQVEWGIFPED